MGIITMHIYLKVKIKTLAAEASDIRNQERKININARARKRMARDLQLGPRVYGTGRKRDHDRIEFQTEAQIARLEKKLARSRARLQNPKATSAFWGLHNHRTNDVRKEARSSLIAYGFLRGLTYHQIEQSNKPVDWDRVEAIIKKYGEDDIRERMQRFAEWKETADKILG